MSLYVRFVRTHDLGVPNKTISVPSDVIPVIEGLEIPFSQWVTARLREYAATAVQPLSQLFEADAELAGEGRV